MSEKPSVEVLETQRSDSKMQNAMQLLVSSRDKTQLVSDQWDDLHDGIDATISLKDEALEV